MSKIRRCDECGKDIRVGGVAITHGVRGTVTYTFGPGVGGPADLCGWQCVVRYADRQANLTGVGHINTTTN